MEGQKSEDWWHGELSKYSIKNYKDMLIYQRFSSCVKPYSKNLGDYREAFWRDDNCYILEWYDRSQQKGEKFGLDYNSYTYFYEHWYYEEDIHIVVKSWLCDPTEWGVLIKYYPDYEEEVSWTYGNDSKVLETKTKRDNNIEKKTSGSKLTPEGVEDFTEKFWETPNGFNREKTWTRGTAKGEEKETKEGDSLRGESWSQDKNQNSQKKWFQEGNHKWGEGEGKEGYENWKEKWDKNSEGSIEEIEFADRFQHYGKMRVRSKSNNYRVEWEGKKPEVTVPESGDEGDQELLSEGPRKLSETDGDSKPVQKPSGLKKPAAKKLRSSRPPGRTGEDPTEESKEPSEPLKNLQSAMKTLLSGEEPRSGPKVDEISKLGFQLSGLYKDLKSDLLEKLSELRSHDLSPDFSFSLNNLEEDLKLLKEPSSLDPQESLSAIQGLREFDKLLTNAEKALVSSQPSTEQLHNLFAHSSSSLSALSPSLDPTNLSSTPQELEYLQKEFENAYTPKDQIRIISSFPPLLDNLLRASQRTVKDEDKEISEISQKLSGLFKAFEDVLRESQQTLKNIQEKFGANEENQTILAAYAERSKEVLKDFESAAAYTKTLPKLNSLLVDMEQYKRQMLHNDLEKALDDIKGKVDRLNGELRLGLAGPVYTPVESGKNVSELLPQVLKGLDQTQVLVDKALGKEVKTGDEELDSIPSKSTETFTVDPADVLKDLWVQGRSNLANTLNSLNTLAEVVGTEEDKSFIHELAEQGEKTVTGFPPESKTAGLEQLSQNLKDYLHNTLKSAELLQALSQKARDSIKEHELKPEKVRDLWKALILAENIADKLIQGQPPSGLSELKSQVDSFPPVPNPADMQISLLKYCELILSLVNLNDGTTAEDLKQADHQTEKRLGGKPKALGKKGKQALRSGRGNRFSFVEPTAELVESSLRTTSELVVWVLGSRPGISKQLESLIEEKEEVLKLLHEKYGSEECTDKLLAFLKKLEDAKQGTYQESDIIKNLSVILQKSEKVIETTAKIVNSDVPQELSDPKTKEVHQNLSDYTKKIAFYLGVFFKLVKDVTGVDDAGDNFEDALKAMKEKQAADLLPFNAEELLRFLNSRSLKDVKRLKFLAGLVGEDEDIKQVDNIEQQAEASWPDIRSAGPIEAFKLIDGWIHTYPQIENQMESKNSEFLARLVDRLLNPEPLERDVANLVESAENLYKAAERLEPAGKTGADLAKLHDKKEGLPTDPRDLVPYLSELLKELSKVVLDQAQGVGSSLTPEEQLKLASDVHKKVKTAPVQVSREIQHLFSGPDTDSTIQFLTKVNPVVNHLLTTNSPDPELLQAYLEGYKRLPELSQVEVKDLSFKLADLLLSLIPQDYETETIQSRRKTTTVTWAEIFKSKGLDIDSSLISEVINEEQQFALVYLTTFPSLFGTPDQKKNSQNLADKSKDILKYIDEKSKIENYFQLRLEQSKLASGLSSKLQTVSERINDLDRERENVLSRGFNEVSILVEQNNPELKDQLQLLIQKEDQYKQKEVNNTIDVLIRLASRLSLEKELQRIKDEAKPKSTENKDTISALLVLEAKLYSNIKSLNSLLSDLSSDLGLVFPNYKHLSEPEVSSTLPGLIASLDTGLSSLSTLISNPFSDSPVKNSLIALLKLLSEQMQKDDSETEFVFSGLFRLCGSSEDKAKAKKLHESRVFTVEDKENINDLVSVLSESLNKLLPTRTEQSKLQSKLIKDAGRMREGVDDIDVSCEDLLSKATREVANSILPEDTRSKENLEKLRKVLEGINEKPATNIPDCVERISQRLDQWEKLERLRRELREKSSKEINRLKGEIQDKLNEISTVKANLDAQKTHYEAQIALLQNTADLNASLVEKLTNEAIEKEKTLSSIKNQVADLKVKNDEIEEDNKKLQDEIDSINKEVRNLRRANKEKDSQIRDLQGNLESFERSTEKSSLGEREKSEVLEKLRAEAKGLREEIDEKVRKIEELSDLLAEKERVNKKLDIERSSLEAELEKIKGERSQLKADLVKTNTEKHELEEKMRLSEGTEEVRHLERILEDKQKELEEAENKLTVAKRYQTLYPELLLEKQDIENKLREALIDYEEFRRKADDSKAENDTLKFKLQNSEVALRDLAEAQKENQKLRIRLNFLEQSGDKDQVDQAKKLADEISEKLSVISDLQNEIDRLKAALNLHIDKYNKSLSRSFLVRICHVFKEQQGVGFRKWRVYKPQKEANIDFTPSQAVASLPPSEEELSDPDSFKSADLALSSQADQLINKNPVVALYKSVDHSSEKPMSFINVFKFLEELMDKKFEADRQCANEQTAVQTMPNFTLDYLNKTFGIQSLALRFLNQFLLGFHDIYKEGQKYAVLFARILQMFHSDPASLAATSYLLRARVDFNPLVEKYDRVDNERGKKKELTGKGAYEAAGTGGQAFLGDTIELVYSLFPGDREGGEKALELIKPDNVSIEDYVAFKICHKMGKLGKTPEMIFTLLDKDQGGTIDVAEFISGTKEDLDLWISDKNITLLLEKLDVNGNKEITKEAFLAKINMKYLLDCNKNPLWTVSRATFLTALLEVFKYKERKLVAAIRKKFNDEVFTKERFTEVITDLDPNMSGENIEKLFIEAELNDDHKVRLGDVGAIASKYGMGDSKSFKNREFLNELNRRKKMMDVIQNEFVSMFKKTEQSSRMEGEVRIDREVEESVVIKKKVIKKVLKKFVGGAF